MSWRLIADVGGTNVRFARALSEKAVVDNRSYRVANFGSFLDALRAFAADTEGGLAGCDGAAIGAAGPVFKGAAHLTNAAWFIRETEVAHEIGAPCMLVNDLEAAAHCLPYLSAGEYHVIGGGTPDLRAARRVLAANIGTGFGAATLISTFGSWISCPSESGHMSLCLPEAHERALRPHFKSNEDALSGRGLSNLHSALGGEKLTAAEICAGYSSQPQCKATVDLFTEIAGDVFGDLALGVAAWDGVFLFGSVAQGFTRVADIGRLRSAFENKGPMSQQMARIPLAVVEKPDAALWGLAALPLPH